MSTSMDDYGPDLAASRPRLFVNHSMVRRGRACAPCHERKVRCVPATDTEDGLPCTRCIKNNRGDKCVRLTVTDRARRLSKRKRHTQDLVQQPTENGQHQHSNALLQATSSLWPRADVNDTSHVLSCTDEIQFPPNELEEETHTSHDSSSELGSLPSHGADLITEEDSQLQICQQMTQIGTDPSLTVFAGQNHPPQGQEVIEYHDGVNPITILSDVFARGAPKRFVRILLRDTSPNGSFSRSSMPWLDNEDVHYLQNKGAFTLPPRSICGKFLRLYFDCLYPYAPILNRVKFMRDFYDGTLSPFLLQCVLANVVPYTSLKLLQDCGFSGHYSAQSTITKRAKLLFDFGVERAQLSLLQGSVMLSSLQFSFGLDNNFTFWFTNAVRLATRMGFHRNHIASEVDPLNRSLFRRIWWVLFNRDVLFVISGLANTRVINDHDSDTAELAVEDWDEDTHASNFSSVMTEITRLKKLYIIENCRLCRIGARFLEAFRTPEEALLTSEARSIEKSLSSWRQSLPSEMRMAEVQDWSTGNVWILILMAMSYRLESVFYRALKGRFLFDNELGSQTERKQLNAMMQLDSCLEQIMLNNLTHFCPLSVTTCASTVVAMHIEMALSDSIDRSKRALSQARIQNGLSYLRIVSENWNRVKWSLRMFGVILCRTGLTINFVDAVGLDVRSINPFLKDSGPQNSRNVNFDARGKNLERTMYGDPSGNAGGDFDLIAERNVDGWLLDHINFDIFSGME